MSVREKMVELCEDMVCSCKCGLCCDCEHNWKEYPLCRSFQFADFLIANGVTVQEWISVEDRLPAKNETVLVCDARDNGYIAIWKYSGNENWRYVGLHFDTAAITHWMPLPEPPERKGVDNRATD